MTVQLSPHKVHRILRSYFQGLSQTGIAKEAGVDQSSVSHYATRFREMTAKYGLTAAGKEYQVLNEVEALRSLSVELYKSRLTTEEALQGHKIIRTFLKLGINPEKHLNLVEICRKVEDPGFPDAALKLSLIEKQTGMDHNKIMTDFETAQKQLPQLEDRITESKAKLETSTAALLKSKQELTDLGTHLEKCRDEFRAKEGQLKNALLTKMKQMEVKQQEIDDVAALRAELTKKGLDLQTLLKLAREF